MIGEMEHDILLLYRRQNTFPGLNIPVAYGYQRLIVKFLFAKVGKMHEILEVMIPVGRNNDIIGTKIQFLCDDFKQVIRHFPVVNKSDRRTPFPLVKASGELIDITFRYIVNYLKFGILGKLDGIREALVKIE